MGDGHHPGAAPPDRFTDGVRALAEHRYPQARSWFTEYLANGAGPHAASRRQQAHGYLALVMLAQAPPSYRTPRDIEQVVGHLSTATPCQLTYTLAALVKEDYFDADGVSPPPALSGLAGRWHVEELTAQEIRLLAAHLAPTPGPAWQRLSDYAADQFGIDVQQPPLAEAPPPDRGRQLGVIRYFMPVPRPPASTRRADPFTLMTFGGGVLLLPLLGLFVSVPWYVAVLATVLFVVIGVGLFFFGVITYWEYRDERRRLRQHERARAAAEPRPSDQQLDDWLRLDIERIVALGAHRHRLNRHEVHHGGDLLIAPQAAVGVSTLQRGDTRTVRIRDPFARSGYRSVHQRVPLAKCRLGRDGRLRADHYRVLVMYLATRRIGIFECELDFASGRLLSESTHAFSYEDVVTISARTVAPTSDVQEALNVLFDDGSGTYTRIFFDDRFTISLADSGRIEVSVGLSGHSTRRQGVEVAWGNRRVQRVVERMIWSRREGTLAAGAR